MAAWKAYAVGLGGVLCALLVLWGAVVLKQRDDALRSAEAALLEAQISAADSAGSKAATKVVIEGRNEVREVYVERNKELDEALEANADWAAQPVPDDVKRVFNRSASTDRTGG